MSTLLSWWQHLREQFHQEQTEVPEPDYRFGRYSDNNKSAIQTRTWYEAERLFREKRYPEAFGALLFYMRDPNEKNIEFSLEGDAYRFMLFQGTKRVDGILDSEGLKATVKLVAMPEANKPVMRRMLDANADLYYSRYALKDGILCLMMDLPLDMCSPGKIYFGLKEMAIRADQQDDLLLDEFSNLKMADALQQHPFTEKESTVKYHYFEYWLKHCLEQVEEMPADSFSGGIGYSLMALLYRIDYLVSPEGKLMHLLDEGIARYWASREELSAVERNQTLKALLMKMAEIPKDTVLKGFYRNTATFALSAAVPYQRVIDHVQEARNTALWFHQNGYTEVAYRVQEYGLLFSLYTFSMPKPYADIVRLFMHINFPAFFDELGFANKFIRGEQCQMEAIQTSIDHIVQSARERYPKFSVDWGELPSNNRLHVNSALMQAIENLNFENPAP
ncbi:MAG: YbjN domain-containing protein [Chitinophagaceae bacterium]|nr:YbjN domain-containing protein [Chitinophagaceae bacterium]